MRLIGYISLTLLCGLILISCTRPDEPSINLYRAVHAGDLDQIKRHIFHGTDLNQRDREGDTALHVAARRGRLVIAEYLVDNGAELEATDKAGRTPLDEALLAGKISIANLLIKKGASIDPQQQLFNAIESKADFRDLFRFLIRHGADVNTTNADGQTPLGAAVAQGDRLLVKRILDAGADVDRPSTDGITPLQLAEKTANDDIIRLLKRYGATENP